MILSEMSVCLSLSLSVCLCLSLSVSLSVCPSVCLSVCLLQSTLGRVLICIACSAGYLEEEAVKTCELRSMQQNVEV